MSKIRNMNGSGKSKLGGYAGPIEIGRGGKRKIPDDFSGAAPPSGFSLARLGFLKRRIIAAFFAATHALTLAPGVIIMSGCESPTNEVKPDTRPPVITEAVSNVDTLQLPDETSITLSASAKSADNSPVKSVSWSVKTAPEGVSPVITDSNQVTTSVTGLTVAGEYIFELEVEGNNGVKSAVEVTVTVLAEEIVEPVNQAPTASAGDDQSVTLSPDISVVLDGSGTDTDGTIESYAWSLFSKPDGAGDLTFVDADKAAATVSGFDKPGDYVFTLQVTDNEGAISAASPVTVTVTDADAPAINNIAISGSVSGTNPVGGKFKYNEVITLGGNSAATGHTYAWTCSPDITFDKIAASPTVSGFAKNTNYTFELTITNQYGVTSAKKQATVSIAANVNPEITTAEATGGTQVGDKREFDFTNALNRSISLSGGANDADGDSLTYTWACTSSPAGAAALTIPAGANPTITGFNKLGDYEFKLTVSDNDGGTALSEAVKVSAYRTASANVSVTPHNQTGGDVILPFTPVYTSDNTADFPVTNLGDYITYTIIATGVDITSNPFTYMLTEGEDIGGGNVFDGEVPCLTDFGSVWTTFTQNFYKKDGTDLNKERTMIAMACGGSFGLFGGAGSPSMDLSIPGVSGISLSKKVTDGDI